MPSCARRLTPRPNARGCEGRPHYLEDQAHGDQSHDDQPPGQPDHEIDAAVRQSFPAVCGAALSEDARACHEAGQRAADESDGCDDSGAPQAERANDECRLHHEPGGEGSEEDHQAQGRQQVAPWVFRADEPSERRRKEQREHDSPDQGVGNAEDHARLPRGEDIRAGHDRVDIAGERCAGVLQYRDAFDDLCAREPDAECRCDQGHDPRST